MRAAILRCGSKSGHRCGRENCHNGKNLDHSDVLSVCEMLDLAGLISISSMDLKGITERWIIRGLRIFLSIAAATSQTQRLRSPGSPCYLAPRKLRTATRELQNAEFETTALEVQLPTSSPMPRTSEKVTMSPLVLKRWSSSGTCRGPKGRTHQSFTTRGTAFAAREQRATARSVISTKCDLQLVFYQLRLA